MVRYTMVQLQTVRYKTVRYKTVHRFCGMLHNGTLQNSVLHFFQEQYNSQKSIKSVDTEDKATNTWIGWTFGLS